MYFVDLLKSSDSDKPKNDHFTSMSYHSKQKETRQEKKMNITKCWTKEQRKKKKWIKINRKKANK